MKYRPTRVLAVIGAAFVLMIGGAVAYAQIPSADGTITGCYMKSGGSIRIIDAASQKCKSGETQLTWNQHGQPGTNGTNGTNGAAGTNGTDGVSGYEMVTKTRDSAANVSGSFGGLSVDCPAGKKVTGGGGSVLFSDGGVTNGYKVIQSYPAADSSGWIATFDVNNSIGEPFTETVYAICVIAN